MALEGGRDTRSIPENIMHARMILTVALSLITAIALIWFISSFFVLEDESPRSDLSTPVPVSVERLLPNPA